jgi:hypothetical protein
MTARPHCALAGAVDVSQVPEGASVQIATDDFGGGWLVRCVRCEVGPGIHCPIIAVRTWRPG